MKSVRALLLVAVLALAGAAPLAADNLTVGKDYYELRRFTDALASLKLAIQENPQNWEAYYYTGLIYQESGKADLALKFYTSAWRAQQGNEKVGKLLTEAYMQMAGKAGPAGAVPTLEGAIKSGFFSTDLVNALLTLYADLQKWDSIVRIGEEVFRRQEQLTVFPRDGSGTKRTHLLVGRAFFESGELRKALEHLEIATVASEPGAKEFWDKVQQGLAKQAEPFVREGDALYRQGSMREARVAFEKAVRLHAENAFARKMMLKIDNVMKAQDLEQRAQDAVVQGNASEALEMLREAAGLYPENQRLMQRIKDIQAQAAALEATKAARQAAADAARRAKQEKFGQLIGLARDFQTAEKFTEAQEAYRKALAIFPDDTEIKRTLESLEKQVETDGHYRRGKELYAEKKWADSIRELRAVDDRSENGFRDSRRFLSLAYLNLNKLDEFEKYASLWLEKKPDDAELLYRLADQAAADAGSTSRRKEALKLFKQIEEVSPGYKDVPQRIDSLYWQIWWPHYLVGSLLVLGYLAVWVFMKQKPKLMKALFLKDLDRLVTNQDWAAAVEMHPQMRRFDLDNRDALAAHANFSRAFYETRQYQKAIGEAQQALRINPRNKELRIVMARAYYAAKIISPDVMEFYFDLLEIEADNRPLLNFVGTFCTEKKLVNDKTMPLLRQLAQVQPENDKVRALLLKGCLKDNDRTGAAMAIYKAERERNPENLDVRIIFAEEHFKKGEIEKAIAECEEMLNISLNYPRTHQLLLDAYTKLGKLPELIKTYQTILEHEPHNTFIQTQIAKLTGQQPTPMVGFQSAAAEASQSGTAVARSGDKTPAAGGPVRGLQKCPKCGNDVPIGGYFCSCGAPL